MADALVAPHVAGVMYVASSATMLYSIHKAKKENKPEKTPVMGVMGAFIFATQMINFTIPGTGSSGHLCGGLLLSALLGPYAGFITMAGVLLIQCLLFGDGGLLALGCNIWNMAFYSCFISTLLIWKPIMTRGMSKAKIITASMLGSIIALQAGAFSVVLQTTISGITALPFGIFAGTMQPIHLAIGAVEGLITSLILIFVYEARPELLYCYDKSNGNNKISMRSTIIILLILTFAIGGGLSLVASSNPDGLEWSIQKITGSTEINSVGTIYDQALKFIDKTAVFPDYSLKTVNSKLGTSLSGIIGTTVIISIFAFVCFIFKELKNRKTDKD